MLLIDEANDSLSTVSFPLGSRPSENSGAVVDSKAATALVSMSDSAFDCTAGVGGCTGQATFDLKSKSFSPLIVTLFDVDSFGLDPSTQISIVSSDPISPQLLGIDVSGAKTCALVDSNVQNLDGDPDGIAVDPTTDIWVAGNFQSPLATVINLQGAAFDGGATLACDLNEGGTPPNSVQHDTGTGALGMPGVAINTVTHQAFMTAQAGNQIALLSLPKSKVTQLADSGVTSVNSTMPNDPDGSAFMPANFPYGTNVDSCHNLGYVINSDLTYLAQVDLKTFQKNPTVISTALPAGTCAGVSTAFGCDNGQGVKFFPLFGTTTTSSTQSLPGQLSRRAFQVRKNAKHRER